MEGNHINIRGTKLYVERHGAENNIPLLYLHGGPGESCFDFTYHQKARLAKDFYLIALDQRGVCRSKRILDEEKFSLMDIIEDCEALRMYLNIKKWSIIGHSFGGYLALLYASLHPSSIEKIVFECPTFDFKLTSKSLLNKTAEIARKNGNEDLAQRCFSLSQNINVSPRKITEEYMKLSDELGENRVEIYQYSFDHPTDYDSAYSDEEWEKFYDRSEVHYDRLISEGKIFDSQLHNLIKVEKPMLLMTAEYDAATCEKHLEKYKGTHGQIYHFNYSGHTPHHEEPDLFSKVIKDFFGISN